MIQTPRPVGLQVPMATMVLMTPRGRVIRTREIAYHSPEWRLMVETGWVTKAVGRR